MGPNATRISSDCKVELYFIPVNAHGRLWPHPVDPDRAPASGEGVAATQSGRIARVVNRQLLEPN